jgi:hypothetical protein
VIICVPAANELNWTKQTADVPLGLAGQGLGENVAGELLVNVIVPVGVFGCVVAVSVTIAVQSLDSPGPTGVGPQVTMVEVGCGVTPQPTVSGPTSMNWGCVCTTAAATS